MHELRASERLCPEAWNRRWMRWRTEPLDIDNGEPKEAMQEPDIKFNLTGLARVRRAIFLGIARISVARPAEEKSKQATPYPGDRLGGRKAQVRFEIPIPEKQERDCRLQGPSSFTPFGPAVARNGKDPPLGRGA